MHPTRSTSSVLLASVIALALALVLVLGCGTARAYEVIRNANSDEPAVEKVVLY